MARVMTMALGLALLLLTSWACSSGASRGTMPPPDANGEVDASGAPDFIAYAGRTNEIIGWVPKSFLLDPGQRCRGPQCDPVPVYADDLKTLIGHDVPGRGFVPLGGDPAVVPRRPVLVGPSLGAPASP